ncbi:MAG TPA: hypothetical protein VNK89_00005, partial [Thermoflexus sp.]|nr:hypothetical protein [Thermoflexus sp.]
GDEFVPHQDLNKREAVAAADNSLIFVNETEQSQRISKASGGFGPLDPTRDSINGSFRNTRVNKISGSSTQSALRAIFIIFAFYFDFESESG